MLAVHASFCAERGAAPAHVAEPINGLMGRRQRERPLTEPYTSDTDAFKAIVNAAIILTSSVRES